jgi:hypothetical protein
MVTYIIHVDYVGMLNAMSQLGTTDRQVKGTDRGVLLPKDGHQEVADVALQLGKYCIDEPVKSPLIFGGKKKRVLCMPNQLHFSVVLWWHSVQADN